MTTAEQCERLAVAKSLGFIARPKRESDWVMMRVLGPGQPIKLRDGVLTMKFTVGPSPEDAHFQPEGDVWTIVREPSHEKMMMWSLPLAVLLGLGAILLWILITPVGLHDIPVLWSIAAMPFCIPIHEIAHASGFPARDWIAKTCFGVWPSRLAFYAHYQGPLSRDRVLVVLVLPFALISISPLVLCSVLRTVPPVAMYVSLGNAFLCSVDLASFMLVLRQVPRSAVVRQQGLKMWWMSPQQDRENAERREKLHRDGRSGG